MARYRSRLNTPVRSAYKRTAWVMVLFGLSESLDLLGTGLAFWYGGRLLSTGELTASQFFIVFTAVVFGGQGAGMLFGFTSNLTKANTAASRILHLRDVVPAINGSTGNDMPPAPPDADEVPAIEFRDVKFAYPTRPSMSVLRHCNLKIMRGQRIGLVGASGCGKTTIISLLERFYDITSGEILIDGVPLTSLDVHTYRSTLALVSQEPTLYQGTVRDNIVLPPPPLSLPLFPQLTKPDPWHPSRRSHRRGSRGRRKISKHPYLHRESSAGVRNGRGNEGSGTVGRATSAARHRTRVD